MRKSLKRSRLGQCVVPIIRTSNFDKDLKEKTAEEYFAELESFLEKLRYLFLLAKVQHCDDRAENVDPLWSRFPQDCRHDMD